MPTPLISVIMPVRNRERYLPFALDSLLAQTFGDWELVAVDDGSTDATPDVLARYARRDPRIRCYRHPAPTIAANRNFALAHASGEFVAVLDSDDIAVPERFARQLDFFGAHPALAGVGSGFTFIDAAGAPQAVEKYKQRLTRPDALRRRQREGWSCFMHTSMLFRRAALEAVGGYREGFRLAEDDDLFLRLLDAHDLANLSDELVRYRWHGGNTTGSLDSFVYRVVALASAWLRLSGRVDEVQARPGPFDYPFFLELLDQLEDDAVPVWLLWIGLLQHYRLGGADLLHEAWRRLDALPLRPEWAAEKERHWQTYSRMDS